MVERWNGGTIEWRNHEIVEPQILKDGITERWNGGKCPQLLKHGMMENHPKS